jgi:small-conductance mechanosensitive channel
MDINRLSKSIETALNTQTALKSRANKAINKTFDKQNITIPFPIQTFNSGIKEGKKRYQMKLNTKRTQKNKHKIVSYICNSVFTLQPLKFLRFI